MDILSFALWASAKIPQGIETLLAATMWRASTTNIPGWQPLLHKFRAHAEDLLPLCDVVAGKWSAPRWIDATFIVQRFDAIYHNRMIVTGKGSVFKTLTRSTGSTVAAARALQRAHAQAAAAGRHALQASRRDKAEGLRSPSRDRTGDYQAPCRDRTGGHHTPSRDRTGGLHHRQAGHTSS
eukprot:5249212-Pyramimonas_sp.AAC.1